MTRDLVLALDVGTQSARAALVDPDGTVIGVTRAPFEPYHAPRPGAAEQDPEVYWQAVGTACAALWAEPVAGERRDGVGGVALTTQRGSVVVSGEDGVPLRPAILWLDQRRATRVPPIERTTALGFRVVGAAGIIAGFQAEAEANWLAQHEPGTWSRIRRFGLLSAWLHHRLAGRWADSAAAQVGYLPFDPKAQTWARAGDWRWQITRIDPSWLPELVAPAERLGDLTTSAADVLGLSPGTPVIAAGADKACEALGLGALSPDVAALSFGSAATVNVSVDRYVEAIRLIPPFPSAVPGRYLAEIQVYRGFWLVEWFRREFGLREVETAARLGVPAESLFDELIRETPPGAAGLLLQPTWSPGHRIPGPEARGAIIGWGGQHTRAHLYRAILEGLAFALREGADRIAGATKVPLREARVAGGGAQSPAAIQIAADVLGLPVGRGQTPEAAALGAAIDGMAGLGVHRDVATAAAAMTRVASVVDPNPAVRTLYDDLFRTVYRPLYPRLQPLYRRLRRITRGAPPPEHPPGDPTLGPPVA